MARTVAGRHERRTFGTGKANGAAGRRRLLGSRLLVLVLVRGAGRATGKAPLLLSLHGCNGLHRFKQLEVGCLELAARPFVLGARVVELLLEPVASATMVVNFAGRLVVYQ